MADDEISPVVRSSADVGQREALAAAVLAALTDQDDLAEALAACAQACVDHVGAAFARVWTLNEFDNVLELQASAGMYCHLDGEHGRIPVGELKIGRIAASRRPHLTNDVVHDPEVSDPEWAAHEGMASFAGYPLMAHGHLVGVVALFARQALSLSALDALAGIADAVAGAIDRHRTAADRERLLGQLDEQRRLLESIIDQMPAGVVIAEAPSGRPILSNRLAEQFDHPLTSEHRTLGTPDLVEWPISRALDGTRVTGEVMRHPDPERDLVLSINAAPVRNSNGTVVAAVSIMDDITDRFLRIQIIQLQSEATAVLSTARTPNEAIAPLLERLGAVLDAAAAALWMVDPTGSALAIEDLWLADPAARRRARTRGPR